MSIFILAYNVKETSFLSKFISEDTTLTQMASIGLVVAITVGIVGLVAFKISTKILYSTLISKLDDIINEIEELKTS